MAGVNDTMPNEIPYPTLTRRYVDLKALPSEERLGAALTTTAPKLVAEFLEAVAAFSSFRVEQPFFPEDADDADEAARRDGPKDDKSATRTFGWAMAMKGSAKIEVDGEPDLDFRYVEREIIPTRTKPQVAIEKGPDEKPGKHVRVDLILANAMSGRPIVGELKIASDKDPFTGLVQALAGASQLVSPAQRARLAALERPLASPPEEPLVDVYVLIGNFPETGRDRFKQLDRAVELAAELEADAELGAFLGRIRVVALTWPGQGPVSATTDLPTAPEVPLRP